MANNASSAVAVELGDIFRYFSIMFTERLCRMLIFRAVESDGASRGRGAAQIVLFSHFVILIASHSVVNNFIGGGRRLFICT